MWSGYLQYDMLYIHYPHSFIPFYIHLTCKINIYYGFTNSLLTNFCQVWSLKSKVRCVTNRCYWLSSNIYKTGHYKNFMAIVSTACCVGSFRISFVWWQLTICVHYTTNIISTNIKVNWFQQQTVLKREITLICKNKYLNFHATL